MNKNLRIKSMAAMCLGYGTAALSGTAGAAEAALPSEVVRYADLNLASPAGARILYHRIQAAASRVCQLDVVVDPHFMDVQKTCYRQAIDAAVRHVGSAALSQIHGVATQHLASR
jgi:UrcA family protein